MTNSNHKVNDVYLGDVSPLVRAERPAGQWQSCYFRFKAPRFGNISVKQGDEIELVGRAHNNEKAMPDFIEFSSHKQGK